MKYFVSILILSIFLVSCVQTQPTVNELGEIIITKYEGKRLDSLNSFRENSIKGPQYVDIENYKLEIIGLVENEISYTYDEVLEFEKYSKIVQLDCVEGWSANILWEGVLVSDLLTDAMVKDSATTIIFHAHDGYTTSFPIEYVLDNPRIMAYKMNNATMLPERGYPFQLVAESKWGYKWIKWITKIELSDNDNYQGYWEKRGYSDTGNLDESFLD